MSGGDVPWGGLAEQHRKLLQSSGIDWSTAKARGYWSAHTKRDMEERGIVTGGRRPPALMVPLWNVLGDRAGYQARPDHPRIDRKGRVVKYETPFEQRVVVDVNPVARAAVRDAELPLFITEGSRKTDSLWVAGAASVSLSGVWNWRDGNGVLPDWDEIPIKGRPVFVVFDSDVMMKPAVHAACARLGSVLTNRGGDVAYVYLPALEDGSKQGVDDYLAAGGTVPDIVARAEGGLRGVYIPPSTGAQAHTPPAEPPPLASDQRILARFRDDVRRKGVHGELHTACITYLVITSRLLDRPVSEIVKGLSASGKSFTVDSTVAFFPEEAVIVMTAMSERALVYSSEDYQHRCIVIGEATGLREGNEDNLTAYFIRSLLSEGRIRYPVTIRDDSGRYTTQEIVKEGPTGMILTTTKARVHAENETRLLSLSTDDSRAQTARVLAALADETDRSVDLDEWHQLQRWLAEAEHRVTIPYAERLAGLVPPVAVRLRRDFGAVLSLIRTHALLHQQNRGRADGQIVATIEDYAIVRALVADAIGASVGSTVPATIRETVDAVTALYRPSSPEDPKTDGVGAQVIADSLGLDRSTVARRLTVAKADHYVRNFETKKGQPGRWATGDPLPGEVDILPDPQILQPHRCTPCTADGDETPGREGVCSCARVFEGIYTPHTPTPPADEDEGYEL